MEYGVTKQNAQNHNKQSAYSAMKNPNIAYKRARPTSIKVEDPDVFGFKPGYIEKIKKDVNRGWRKFKEKHQIKDYEY